MGFRFHALFDRLQNVLLISFTLIAVVTFIVGIWTTSVIVNNYTERAENERVARDMNLAVAFYERSLLQIRGAAARLAGEPALAQQIEAIQEGDQATQDSLGDLVVGELESIYPAGTHFILIMDGEGNLVLAYGIFNQRLHRLPAIGNWRAFPLLADVLSGGRSRSATVPPPGPGSTVGLWDDRGA